MSMTSKRAADILGMAVTFNGCGRCTSDELREAVRLATAALREKAEREDPKPLTLDELKQMDDEPFYVHIRFEWRGAEMPPKPLPAILDTVKDVEVAIYCGNENSFLKLSDYGKTWSAYRHKPKEVTK